MVLAPLKRVFALTKTTLSAFGQNGGPLLAAGLSFYALLSLAPLMLVVFAVASYVLEATFDQPSADLHSFVTSIMEPAAADITLNLLTALKNHQQGTEAGFVGSLLLLWSATRLLRQLQDALHQLWQVRMTTVGVKRGLFATLRSQTQVIGTVFLIVLLVVLSVFTGSASAVLRGALGPVLPGTELWWSAVTVGSSIGSLTLLFALLLRLLPAVTVSWQDAFVGAFVTALLFAGLQYPLNYYLGQQGVMSLFGATGSLVMFLLWVYWAAQVFFLGAQFTLVWAQSHRRFLQPSKDGAFRAEPNQDIVEATAAIASPSPPEPAKGAQPDRQP